MIASWLSALFPPRCLECRSLGARLCASCLARHSPGWQQHGSLRVFCLGHYKGGLKQALLRLKEGSDPVLLDLLARWCVEQLRNAGLERPQALTGVPTSARRRRWRGYCLPSTLACQVGRLLALPVFSEWALQGDPAPRKRLGKSGRQSDSLQFAVSRHPPERLLLLDDIVTSGATLAGARQALLNAGAGEVTPLAWAGVQNLLLDGREAGRSEVAGKPGGRRWPGSLAFGGGPEA